jgi:curved DNA-binding protein CbpA
MDTTLYEPLGVEPDASSDEIKAAYRRLARQVHPDAGRNAALFRQIQEAFDTLSDPQRRSAYDRTRTAAPEPGLEPEPEPEESAYDPEDDPAWTVVDDGSGEEPFAAPAEARWQEAPRRGFALGNVELDGRTRLVGAFCGILVACAWIGELSFASGPAIWGGRAPHVRGHARNPGGALRATNAP